MRETPLVVEAMGLVTSVGLSAPACCAAIRAKLTNPTETRFADSVGEWMLAHEVPLGSVRGLARLARMAAMAIEEALSNVPRQAWGDIALLLCVAEPQRPGRQSDLDHRLLPAIEEVLDARFSPRSAVVAQGRVGAAVAMSHAQTLVAQAPDQRVVVAAVDSLLNWPVLQEHDIQRRLLASGNSDGFMPGEGGGALLVAAAQHSNWAGGLQWMGVGFGVEQAHVASGEPLRADGLCAAIRGALGQAGMEMHEIDYRIADLSGEQYYFKEASLALGRILRRYKEDMPLWHPAEAIGETGAVAGIACVIAAQMAAAKGYAPGRSALLHLSDDAGRRAAAVLVQG